MKVLVACEFSGIVRDAFLERGHDAISCDLLPTERPGPHIQGDVTPLLREPWDLVIAHPPCTHLSNARARWPVNFEALNTSIVFFKACQNANAPRIAVENPLPSKYARHFIGEPDCWVEPFQFGHAHKKRTGLWLCGLPILLPKMQGVGRFPTWTGSVAGEGVRDAKGRSRFWPGMAAAMADQWGTL